MKIETMCKDRIKVEVETVGDHINIWIWDTKAPKKVLKSMGIHSRIVEGTLRVWLSNSETLI